MQNQIASAQNFNQIISATQPKTGIWYSTWYANEGNYIWRSGHGIGSSSQMLADVNGDAKDDSVVYFEQTGSWYVALSNGKGFDGYNQWTGGHGVGSASQMLADVNGDAKADAIVYFGQTGEWYVALANGYGFNSAQQWRWGHGIGSSSQMLADVNGDAKADAIVYFGQTGEWYVALSNGFGFDGYNRWSVGSVAGSSSQMLADVNGDGRSDAISYFAKTGDWYVALSNGSGFANASQWITGYGIDSTRQMVGDVNSDGLADAVVYFGGHRGDWYVAHSNKKNFDSYSLWKSEHGQSSKYNNNQGSTWQGLGRVYSDASSYAPITYYAQVGEWRALPSDKYSKPNILNTWEAWNIKANPLTLGSYRQYDSQETAVIDEHLKLISQAGIDFLILDLTNNIDVDEAYIKKRAKVVSERITLWNSNGNNRTIKYAVAVGGMQFNSNPDTLEQEAHKVWNQFVSDSGTNNYFYLDGKPLLINYSSTDQQNIWTRANIDKSGTNNFNLQWAQGEVQKVENNNLAFSTTSDSNSYFGWAFPQGAIENKQVMVVMPDWNNSLGGVVPSAENATDGDFYKTKGWERVLATNPKMVVINSFNEYFEKTAIAPADTSALPPSQQWSSPGLYWDVTVNYNTQYKSLSPNIQPQLR